MKRVFLIILDSFGIGFEPDAAAFVDVGANTLASVTKSPYLNIPNLTAAGLGCIDGVDCINKCVSPNAAYGRMRELSAGKDTTIGHWEIAGLISTTPLPTYPNGFPEDVIDAFRRATGRNVICNKPYSGTVVIKEYGDEHVASGDLIVYTSADSVFQIAAHESVVPPELLYEYCKAARRILCGKHAVGRVIARPFAGSSGNYVRTANRRDFSLEPTGRTMLDAVSESGKSVIAVGKINDIFAGVGITEVIPSHGNAEGMKAALECLGHDFNGLCFINLVDFDMLYGHRNDADGYAKALTAFDGFLPDFLRKMQKDDMLIITADHGCDPGDVSTDHTREYVPLLIYGDGLKKANLGTRNGFCDVAATVCGALGCEWGGNGTDIMKEINRNEL